MSSFNHRGLSLARLAPILLVLVLLVWFRDVWLPPVYSKYRAGLDGQSFAESFGNDDQYTHSLSLIAPSPASPSASVFDDQSWPLPLDHEGSESPEDAVTRPYDEDSIITDASPPPHASSYPASSHHDENQMENRPHEEQSSESTNETTSSSASSPHSSHASTGSDAHSHLSNTSIGGSTFAADPCQHVPGADRVMVMLKTGATELYQKLPTHFVTTFRCIPKFMIFSDSAQTFADIPIHDAIAAVSDERKEEHEDFGTYRKILQWQGSGQDLGQLRGEGGWNLDKWKFMPMLFQTFEAADNDIDWFVMIEADTSLSWSNLLIWLQRMDHTQPLYLGAQNWIGDTTFGHGGSGIVISRAAADALAAHRRNEGIPAYDARWEHITSTSCCGDEIVARALAEVDVLLSPAWPLIQGETVATLDWTEGHWCAPPISWHHVSPLEVDQLYQFQTQWTARHGWTTPYLFRDVFDYFVAVHIAANRSAWNNLSHDVRFAAPDLAEEDDVPFDDLAHYERAAIESEEACAEACLLKDNCVQWMFKPGRCQLGQDIRFGHSDDRDEEHFTSGWMQERIVRMRDDMTDCAVRWEPSEDDA